MLVLSLDTSTRVCSVALHQNGALLGCYELLTEKTHSSLLTTLIQDLVTHAGFSLGDLDQVAVAKGPGSYTGLRIGVSTAKGLCFSLDKPLVSVHTLEAMAAQLTPFYPSDHLLCPMIDARRMEVYCAFYQSGELRRETAAVIIDENSFSDLLDTHRIVFFGDGAAKCRETLGKHPNAIFPPTEVHPSARTVGQLVAAGKGATEDLASFEPFYLKEFIGTTPKNRL